MLCSRVVLSSRLPTTWIFSCGKPASFSPFDNGLRMFFTDQNRDIHAVGHLFAECAVEFVLFPPSSTMPGVMMIRRPGKSLMTRSALRADRVGVERVVDNAHARAADSSSSRCSTGWQRETPSAIS